MCACICILIQQELDRIRALIKRAPSYQEDNWRRGRKDFPVALRAGVAVPLYGDRNKGVGQGAVKRKRKAKVHSPFPGGPEYIFGADHRLKGRTWGMGKCAPNANMHLGSHVTGRSCRYSRMAASPLPTRSYLRLLSLHTSDFLHPSILP